MLVEENGGKTLMHIIPFTANTKKETQAKGLLIHRQLIGEIVTCKFCNIVCGKK